MFKVDYALSQNKISGVILICYENDRPLRGLIADLDWHFNGPFSKLIKSQTLTGAQDEVVYAPLRWNEQTFHFVVLGGGFLNSELERPLKSRKLFDLALKKVEELKLKNMAASRTDWNISEDHPGARERGVWIVN